MISRSLLFMTLWGAAWVYGATPPVKVSSEQDLTPIEPAAKTKPADTTPSESHQAPQKQLFEVELFQWIYESKTPEYHLQVATAKRLASLEQLMSQRPLQQSTTKSLEILRRIGVELQWISTYAPEAKVRVAAAELLKNLREQTKHFPESDRLRRALKTVVETFQEVKTAKDLDRVIQGLDGQLQTYQSPTSHPEEEHEIWVLKETKGLIQSLQDHLVKKPGIPTLPEKLSAQKLLNLHNHRFVQFLGRSMPRSVWITKVRALTEAQLQAERSEKPAEIEASVQKFLDRVAKLDGAEPWKQTLPLLQREVSQLPPLTNSQLRQEIYDWHRLYSRSLENDHFSLEDNPLLREAPLYPELENLKQRILSDILERQLQLPKSWGGKRVEWSQASLKSVWEFCVQQEDWNLLARLAQVCHRHGLEPYNDPSFLKAAGWLAQAKTLEGGPSVDQAVLRYELVLKRPSDVIPRDKIVARLEVLRKKDPEAYELGRQGAQRWQDSNPQ